MSLNEKSIQKWVGLGRYYAMFQKGYAEKKVEELTQPEDWVLDPFLGRGSTSFAAATTNRNALGLEINPIAWVFAITKANPASEENLCARLHEIAIAGYRKKKVKTTAEFFHKCYSPTVLKFLEAARENLDWKNRKEDWTLASIIAMAMQTGRESGLSNQLQETKAMGPAYAIRWWSARELTPPDVDPETVLLKKIKNRYAHGKPPVAKHHILLGDATTLLKSMHRSHKGKCSLLLTSPPYMGVCNYHTDQWLRLWLLGENGEHPNWKQQKKQRQVLQPTRI